MNNLPNKFYEYSKSNRVRFLDELNMAYKDSIVVRGAGNLSRINNKETLQSLNDTTEEGETDIDIEEDSKHNLVTI